METLFKKPAPSKDLMTEYNMIKDGLQGLEKNTAVPAFLQALENKALNPMIDPKKLPNKKQLAERINLPVKVFEEHDPRSVAQSKMTKDTSKVNPEDKPQNERIVKSRFDAEFNNHARMRHG